MTTLERLWISYCAVVVIAVLAAGGGGGEGFAPGAFVAVHVAVAAMQCVPALVRRRRAPGAQRVVQAVLACVGLPIVFSALSWVLPHVNPEPFELAWYRVDLCYPGSEATALLRGALPTWSVLPLQLVYAAFYGVPAAAVLLVLRVRGVAACDRALAILVGSFLCSYLGYLWFPTLAPKVVLPGDYGSGGAVADVVHSLIDRFEANPRDCFPSGHTMLSITSAMVVWRWARPFLPHLLIVVVPLCASTMLLRYHWPIDVVAGAALAWPIMRLCDWLLDRDGAPPA